MANFSPLLIDWMTLRHRVDTLPPILQEKLFSNMNVVCSFKTDAEGNPTELDWESRRLNFDALRSDSDGLYFTCTYVENTPYLYIGASPASLEHDTNVFGSLDIVHCAEVLIARARRAFDCLLGGLADLDWELKRLDVTGNYALPDAAFVKTALRQLLASDTARRKPSSAKNGGDTVLFAPTSDVFAGKAYHKGPHLRHLSKKAKIVVTDDLLGLADRLLRLELRIGSRFFRHMTERRKHQFYGRDWRSFTPDELTGIYMRFFEPFVCGVEVKDMGRVETLEKIIAGSGITAGRARAAYKTLGDIRESGWDEVKASMPERTFYLHVKYLRAAGFTDSDLRSFTAGNVVQFKPVRVVLAQPVGSWDEIRRAA